MNITMELTKINSKKLALFLQRFSSLGGEEGSLFLCWFLLFSVCLPKSKRKK